MHVWAIAVARSGKKLIQLGLNRLKVCIEQVIQQAALRRTDLLAALGKLVAFLAGRMPVVKPLQTDLDKAAAIYG